MIDLFALFRDGGPFAYLVLLGALTAGPPALVAMALSLAKFRVPTAVYALWPMGLLLVGMIGTITGLGQATDAVAVASPEMRATLMAAGGSVAQYTSALAGIFAVPILLISALAAALSRIARIDEGEFTPLHTVAPLLLGLVSGVALAVFFGLAAGAVAFVGGVAIAFSALRSAEDSDEAKRVAPIRLGVTGLGVVAALVLGWTYLTLGRIQAMDATAHASAETKQELMAQAAAALQWSLVGPMIAAGVLLLAGVLASAPVARHLATGRTLLHGALFGLLLVPPVGALAYQEMRLSAATELMQPYGDQRLEELAELGVELPSSTAVKPHAPALTLTASPEQVWVDGRGLPTHTRGGLPMDVYEQLAEEAKTARDLGALTGDDLAFEGELSVEADRRITMKQLQPLLAAATQAEFSRFHLVTVSDLGLAVIEVHSTTEPNPSNATNPFPSSEDLPVATPEETSEMAPMPDRFVELTLEQPEPLPDEVEAQEIAPVIVAVTSAGGTLEGPTLEAPIEVSRPEEVTQQLTLLKDAIPDEEALDLYVTDELTVESLVTWLDAVREDEDSGIGGRPRVLFPDVELAFSTPPADEDEE